MTSVLRILFLILPTWLFAQIQLSDVAEIRVLTMGPGPELYDSFGHTAIRVVDSKRGIDAVYNYGVFDFDTPNFYGKFAQGKLNYRLARQTQVDRFLAAYKAQNRSIQEQVLDLRPQQVQKVFEFLENNYKPENRYYLYDFFYDNCATRPVGALYAGLGDDLKLSYAHQPEGLTHRDLIHHYVPWNSWGRLGIDLALGSVIDRPAAPREYLFLPEYVGAALAESTLENNTTEKPLVKKSNSLFTPETPIDRSPFFLWSPLFILGLLALGIIFKTLKDFRQHNDIQRLDPLLLTITGIVGVLLSLLWFATDHTATQWNYNLLWAFPFHLLAALVVAKQDPPQWIYPYMKLAVILMALLFFHWIIGVQEYPITILPLLLAITFRYVFILRCLRRIRAQSPVI